MIDDLMGNPTQRDDGMIGDGVYVAYDWIMSNPDRELCRIYIGTKQSGPILQYDADGTEKWDGWQTRNFPAGAWTLCYSRGNFGRRYACGGNWSGHSKGLHPRIAAACHHVDKTTDDTMILVGDDLCPVPPGVKPDGTLTNIDCSPSWGIFFLSAADALDHRLTAEEMLKSNLPPITITHLTSTETPLLLEQVREVLETYRL